MIDINKNSETPYAEKAAQLKALIDDLLSCAPGAKERVVDEGRRFVDQGRELYEHGKDKACQATRQVADTVRRHPVETAVIALGAGLLTWWLVTRRSSSSSF